MPIAPDGTQLPYDDAGLMALMGGNQPQADPQTDLPVEEAVAQVRSILRAVIEKDGISEQERLDFENVMSALQKFAANREKEKQAALGGGPATNMIRRMLGG